MKSTIPHVPTSSHCTTVHVSLGERSYDIVIGHGELANIAATVEPWTTRFGGGKPSRTAAVITDRNIVRHAETVAASLRGTGWAAELIVLEPGEKSKCLEVVAGVYDRLVAMKADRRSVIFAVGGGVVGDAAGFVAATYNRGLPFVQVPTSLLADVDSSVGGKVGVNHPLAKNLIGAFHQPLGVVIDTDVLATLPDREFRAGLAEVVKYGVILDADFFAFLELHAGDLNAREPRALRQAIARSCELKAQVVEQDEFERTGLRAVLNYGHTFGHAFEALCRFSELLHGEAVAIGMEHAARLAQRLGRVDAALVEQQTRLLAALHLPIYLPEGTHFGTDEVIDRMRLDKKTVAGRLRFVLPTRLGHVELVDNVSEDDVRAVLAELA